VPDPVQASHAPGHAASSGTQWKSRPEPEQWPQSPEHAPWLAAQSNLPGGTSSPSCDEAPSAHTLQFPLQAAGSATQAPRLSARLQVSQFPLHALSQHTPSAQAPLAHSPPTSHASPLALGAWQVPSGRHRRLPAQSPGPAQEVLQVVAVSHANPLQDSVAGTGGAQSPALPHRLAR
jgi:ABC-type uncharacterized transport system involved in gliding motility auxiliary subunit